MMKMVFTKIHLAIAGRLGFNLDDFCMCQRIASESWKTLDFLLSRTFKVLVSYSLISGDLTD